MKLFFPLLITLLFISCSGNDGANEAKTMTVADSANMLMDKAGKMVHQAMQLKAEEKDSLPGPDTTSKASLLFINAREYYFDAVKLDPANYKAWSFIGTTYYFTRQPELSLPYFRKSVQLKNDYKEAWFNLGMACEQTGKNDSAMLAFSQCIRIDSAFTGAYARLSHLIFHKEQQPDHAIALLQLASRHQPASDIPWSSMSTIYFQLKDTTNAIAALETAAKLRPDNKTRLYNLALYFHEHNDSAKYNLYLHQMEELEKRRQTAQ